MIRTIKPILILVILICCLVTLSSASERRVASADRIPSGDWMYDAMISLASDNLVPGMAARVFQGDRLFNRLEMADVVISILNSQDLSNFTPNQQSLISKLYTELKPEIMFSTDTAYDVPTLTAKPVLTGYAQLISSHNAESDNSFDVPYHATGIVDIQNRIFAVGTIADKNTKFFHKLRDSSFPDKLFIKGNDENFQWTIGSQYMNWGPSYAGSMILSDNSNSFLQINAVRELDFGKLLGRFKVSQFGSTFEENDKTFYLFGRRYERPLFNKHLFLGISETAKTDKLPNPLIAFIPYYLYQNIFDVNFNILDSIDFTYQTHAGNQVYTDFMVDDMSASRFFQLGNHDWKRKTGYTIGAYMPKVLSGKMLTTLRAEYISIDPKTYGPVSGTVKLPYTHGSLLIGHPIGPNTNAVYLRGEHYLTPKLSLIAEYLNQKQKGNVEPFRDASSIVSAQISYDFKTDTSMSVRVAPIKTKTPGSGSDNDTEFGIQLMKSF